MEAFWLTTQIVFGILSPIIIVWVLWAIASALAAWQKEASEKNIKHSLLNGNWSFVRKEVCPNPEYIGLVFSHDKTKNLLSIAMKRSALKDFTP